MSIFNSQQSFLACHPSIQLRAGSQLDWGSSKSGVPQALFIDWIPDRAGNDEMANAKFVKDLDI